MKYDYIIVGAGSAGSVLAARLSEDPAKSVLLLEAGPDYPDFETLPDDLKFGYGTPAGIIAMSHDWGYVAKAAEGSASIPLPRGKVTGGSSAVNAQIFLHGLPEDFERWVALGNDRWSFAEVLPYYRKLETDLDFNEEWHGKDGPIRVRRPKRHDLLPAHAAFYEACLSAGFPDCPDLNHPHLTGVGPMPMNNENRIRCSTALAYLNPARQRSNLTIRPDCMVRKIVFEGKRAAAVEIDGCETSVIHAGGEIILSAGALGSPQLLMLSGVGPLEQLPAVPKIANLPGVGQNLRDHPAVPMSWAVREDFSMDAQANWHEVALRYTARDSDLRDDMIIYMATVPGERIILMRPTVNLAMSAGEIRLASPDPAVPPTIDCRYFQTEMDRRRMREAIRLCISLVEHQRFEVIVANRIAPGELNLESDAALDDWMGQEATTGHHLCGTCKMGPASDPMAVVNQSGQVHGLQGLRVVDASILPDCVRANINATVMMMAERMADFIRNGRSDGS